ncbi:unnamed protein product [Rhizopus microsporus]
MTLDSPTKHTLLCSKCNLPLGDQLVKALDGAFIQIALLAGTVKYPSLPVTCLIQPNQANRYVNEITLKDSSLFVQNAMSHFVEHTLLLSTKSIIQTISLAAIVLLSLDLMTHTMSTMGRSIVTFITVLGLLYLVLVAIWQS